MHYIIILLFATFSLSAYAQDKIVVSQTSGEVEWTIASIENLAFDGHGVMVSFTDKTSVYYSSSTLNMIKFNSTATSIGKVSNDETIDIINNSIVSKTENISIYTPDGRKIAHTQGRKLDISKLNEGVYIVNNGGLTYKISKR